MLEVLAPPTTYLVYVLFGLVYFSYFDAIPNTNRDWAVAREQPFGEGLRGVSDKKLSMTQ